MDLLRALLDFLAQLFRQSKAGNLPLPAPKSPPLSPPASPARTRQTDSVEIENHVFASSFADPLDVARFRRCKARGLSDQDCFKIGDNGIGCWGDDCTTTVPMCALPPEDMEERWGSVDAAKHKAVHVAANDREVTCILGDRMPHRAHITNGARIDLSPAAVGALGLKPPIMIRAAWKWAEA